MTKKFENDALLDFCRVKKIFDKEFGFLTSLYHEENVFFHFSKIKDQSIRNNLLNFKRGTVLFFYTSQMQNGQRKVKQLWTNIEDVPKYLLNKFKTKLIQELNEGETNPFEIVEALLTLQKNNNLTEDDLLKIKNSKKCLRTPSILKSLLDSNTN